MNPQGAGSKRKAGSKDGSPTQVGDWSKGKARVLKAGKYRTLIDGSASEHYPTKVGDASEQG